MIIDYDANGYCGCHCGIGACCMTLGMAIPESATPVLVNKLRQKVRPQ